MKRYMWKKSKRKFDGYWYQIVRIYNPAENGYEFRLERKEAWGYCVSWNHVNSTQLGSAAKEWSDEMGISISDTADRIRKPLL